MDDPNKYVYAKFLIGKKPLEVMETFIISEDRDSVNNWNKSNNKTGPQEEQIETSVRSPFQIIARDFEKSIDVFEKTVPFIMSILPLVIRLSDDRDIRGFVREVGERLEQGEHELYRLRADLIPEINKRLVTSIAIASGISRLPGMFIVGLVSAYDTFLAQLIRTIFMTCPELLSSSERNISFRDLTEIGSVEAARERIIEKEVETVIRESHADQIKWLENKLKVPLTKNLKIWPDFIEVCERRNLLTHTEGAVASQYLKVCKEHGYDTKETAVGEIIGISEQYYKHAVHVILEFASKMVQVIWRKLCPDDVNLADRELNEFGYRLLVKRNYKAAITMLRFGIYEMKKHGSDATRKSMTINYANAEKLGGDKEASARILDAEDWSAATDKFRICVAAVKDELDVVLQLMGPVVNGGLMQIPFFRDWPVFETMRSNPRFIEAFEREFGQKLFIEREAAGPGKAKSVDDVELAEADRPQSDLTLH